ncbi:teneurin-m-like [Oppia nitens]|uniref:teneurin-m-like n=1 Tax=Oppia nitens TaxID=1686743 RepID=UPI0023DC1510|nr:teneurin-m-like [Oppia nitens]
MNSLSRKGQIGGQLQTSSRLRRQRSKEWRDYSSSDNEYDHHIQSYKPSPIIGTTGLHNIGTGGGGGVVGGGHYSSSDNEDEPASRIPSYKQSPIIANTSLHNGSDTGGGHYSAGSDRGMYGYQKRPTYDYSLQHQYEEPRIEPRVDSSVLVSKSTRVTVNNTNTLKSNSHIYTNPFPKVSEPQNTASTGTTGPMIPLPNNIQPSQLMQYSCSGNGAPPTLCPPQQSGSRHGPQALIAFANERFNLDKTCSHRCSWRFSTIILTIACLVLFAVVTYLMCAMNSLIIPPESSKVPCIVMEDMESSASIGASIAGSESIGTTIVTPSQQPNQCLKLIPRDPIEFTELKLGLGPLTITLDAHESYSLVFNQPDAVFLRFIFTIPTTARLALLGRKNEPPSLTAYHMLEVISQDKSQKLYKRDAQPSADVELLQYFEPGAWYLTIINDIDDTVPLVFTANIAKEVPTTCPNNCHNHGNCHLGKCQCFPGYIGHDCADNVCPVLCGGHGRYLQGSCRCETGWKGPECNIRATDCEVSDCNGHGKCVSGVCHCLPGFRGDNCDIVDCLDPLCSAHGACIDGQCWCKVGWTGVNCTDADQRLSQFFPNCSQHGVYDLDTGKCVCFPHFTGINCDIAKCNLDCGAHGVCEGGRCVCDNGWHGSRCDEQTCDHRCLEHGQCHNGTCICIQGWMGKHCTLDGCPKGCSSHGQCVQRNDEWMCRCKEGWGGRDCSAPQETNCADDIDNDNDGLSDCADSECCSTDHCHQSLMCISSPDPLDILLRKQPPAVTASFYQKMKFLIEESSVQSYAHKDEYFESLFWSAFKPGRVSVIRGQVISREGNGLIGIRVSVATDPQFGFTLTRGDGWFDILVNGGGAIVLQFQRNPFHPIKRTILVPWNDIIVMLNPVVMSSAPTDDKDSQHTDPLNTGIGIMISDRKRNQSLWHCRDHDYDVMKPLLHETLRPGAQGGCTEKSAVIAETQVLQESLAIPGSHLHLVYHSSYSQGYLSTINVQLTPSTIPKTLRLVYLRIIIEGILFEKTFEADPDIKYTYSWNKRNIYKQKVYGITTAKVFVGYVYKDCKQTIWTALSTTLRGYDMDISELGSWNLDIHHRYNFHEGVLQKGDGTTVFFKQQPRVISVLMGNGLPRNIICGKECNGLARDNRLMAPIALASGPDGSVYVGDANLIRRITADKQVYTVYKHKSLRPSYQYHIMLSPIDGHLYISDPEKHQILRLHSLDKVDDPENNLDVVVGNGDRCFPHDPLKCGDGKPAPEARLIYPKGMAFGTDGALYFADGNSIRMVDNQGIIHTIIGDRNHQKQWKPIPCKGTLAVNEIKLHWPTHVAINPLEGTLYFIDDHMVMKLTPDRRVMIVAGMPAYCKIPDFSNQTNSRITDEIGFFANFAFGPTGILYITEVSGDGVNRVRALTHDTELIHFAGKKANTRHSCPVEMCRDVGAHNCTCALPTLSSITQPPNEFEEKTVLLARDTRLVSITALTLTSNGVLHMADAGNLRILSAVPYIPQPDEQFEFQIAFPDGQEMYIFNKYGQHTVTKSIITGRTLYTFLYNVNTSFGKLSAVTDASGNKVSFLRDSVNSLHTIETTRGQKCRVLTNKQGFLEQFISPDNMTTKFTYDPSGLMVSRSDSAGHSFFYFYDHSGRLVRYVRPTGLSTELKFDFNQNGALVKTVDLSASESPIQTHTTIVKVRGESFNIYENGIELKTFIHLDGSVEVESPWKETIYWEAQPHKVLLSYLPVQAGMFPVLMRQTLMTESNQKPWIGWDYDVKYNRRSEKDKNIAAVERILVINETQFLSVEYDWIANREILYNNSRRPFLFVQYDDSSRPVQWLPKESRLPLNMMYDRFGRLSGWQEGQHSETYSYDRMGHLSEIRFSDATSVKNSYEDGRMSPTKVVLRSGRKYLYTYDGNGGLRTITTPKGSRHAFLLEISLGFYKLVYTTPNNINYVIYLDAEHRPIMKTYPNDSGKLLYVYNNRSQLREIVYGAGKVERFYHKVTGLLIRELWTYDDQQMALIYEHTGALLSKQMHQFVSSYLLSNLVFSYQYDSFGRLKLLSTRVGSVSLPHIDYAYHPRTGRLEAIGNFRIHDKSQNETFLTDGTATYSKAFDASHYLLQSSLVIADKEVFRMDLSYNSNGALIQSKTFMRHLGASKVRVQNYTYDYDQQLTEVTGRDHWKFQYDDNSNLATMQYMGNRIDILYDAGDRITSFGETPYIMDAKGFVIQRGEEKFTFNTLGQLMRANRPSRYDVKYMYDPRGRLTVRKDSYGNVTQYFYGDITRPNLVTHTFNNADARVTTIIYDAENVPVMTQVNHEVFYIACDQIQSPLLVLDHRGEVVKEVHRGPYGHVLFDSNPAFYLAVDFQGGIPDPLTGLIHFSDNRVYDSLVGQWLSPDWDQLLSTPNKPQSLHAYRFNRNDPINAPTDERWNMLDLNKWIQNQGIELSAFDIGLQSIFSRDRHTSDQLSSALKSIPKVTVPALPIVSGFACGLQRILNNFGMISSLDKSKVKSEDLFESIQTNKISSESVPFGHGISISRVSGHAVVHSTSDADPIRKDVFTQILNNSYLLNVHFVIHGNDVFYFVKNNTWRVADDLTQLQRLSNHVNQTVHESKTEDQKGSGHQVDVRIHIQNYILNIRYGTTPDRERHRVLRHAKKHAIGQRWAQERELLANNRDSSTVSKWSEAEKELLLTTGLVPGVKGDYNHDPSVYPELADDPSNIVFHKPNKLKPIPNES